MLIPVSAVAACHCTVHLRSVTLCDVRAGHVCQQTVDTMAPFSMAGSEIRDSLAAITTDTGAFKSGHHDFSNYTTPELCYVAAIHARDVLRRSLTAQAALAASGAMPTQDTLPTGAVTIARACGARFTPTGVRVQDLPVLFDLALLAQHDAMAHAVVQRQLALASRAAARDTVLEEAIAGYLGAEPARVAAADSLLAQVDAQGQPARLARLVAHAQMLTFAAGHYDRPRIQQEGERVIALGKGLSARAIQSDSGKGYLEHAYRELIAVAFVAHPDSLLAIAQRAKEDLQRFPENGQMFRYSTASLDAVLSALQPDGFSGDFVRAITPTAPPLEPLQAAYWFPAKPASWPLGTGAVSLVLSGGFCLDAEMHQIYDVDREQYECPMAWKVREWAAKYIGKGLSFTVVVPTWGATLRSVALQPTEEAVQLRWYFLDYLKLPVTVAVVPYARQQLLAPDKRLFVCAVPERRWFVCEDTTINARRYLWDADRLQGVVQLLGRDGRVLYQGELSPLLDVLLERIVGMPAAVTSPGTSIPGAPISSAAPQPALSHVPSSQSSGEQR